MTPATSSAPAELATVINHRTRTRTSRNTSTTGNQPLLALTARTAHARYEHDSAHRSATVSAIQGANDHSPGSTAPAPPGARVAVSFQLQRPMAWSHGDND